MSNEFFLKIAREMFPEPTKPPENPWARENPWEIPRIEPLTIPDRGWYGEAEQRRVRALQREMEEHRMLRERERLAREFSDIERMRNNIYPTAYWKP